MSPGRLHYPGAVQPSPLFRDDRVALYGLEHLFFAVWEDAPRMEQMRALAEHGRRFEEAHGPLALMNIAAAGTPKFPDDVRRIAAEFTADPSLFQLARAHVILMTGFVGVAVRAFINTFILLGKPPRPTRMLPSIEAASQWLPQHIQQDRWTPEAIAQQASALVPVR